MSILVDRNTEVITQGMTGETGTFQSGGQVDADRAAIYFYTYPV